MIIPPSAERLLAIVRKADIAPDALATQDLDDLAVAYRVITRDDESPLAGEYSELTDGEDLQQAIAMAASVVSPHPSHWLVDLMLSTIEHDQSFYEAVHAVLNLTIPKSEASVKAGKLSAGQIHVLSRIAATVKIWDYDMSLMDRLAERGLPTSRHRLHLMLTTIGE